MPGPSPDWTRDVSLCEPRAFSEAIAHNGAVESCLLALYPGYARVISAFQGGPGPTATTRQRNYWPHALPTLAFISLRYFHGMSATERDALVMAGIPRDALSTVAILLNEALLATYDAPQGALVGSAPYLVSQQERMVFMPRRQPPTARRSIMLGDLDGLLEHPMLKDSVKECAGRLLDCDGSAIYIVGKTGTGRCSVLRSILREVWGQHPWKPAEEPTTAEECAALSRGVVAIRRGLNGGQSDCEDFLKLPERGVSILCTMDSTTYTNGLPYPIDERDVVFLDPDWRDDAAYDGFMLAILTAELDRMMPGVKHDRAALKEVVRKSEGYPGLLAPFAIWIKARLPRGIREQDVGSIPSDPRHKVAEVVRGALAEADGKCRPYLKVLLGMAEMQGYAHEWHLRRMLGAAVGIDGGSEAGTKALHRFVKVMHAVLRPVQVFARQRWHPCGYDLAWRDGLSDLLRNSSGGALGRARQDLTAESPPFHAENFMLCALHEALRRDAPARPADLARQVLCCHFFKAFFVEQGLLPEPDGALTWELDDAHARLLMQLAAAALLEAGHAAFGPCGLYDPRGDMTRLLEVLRSLVQRFDKAAPPPLVDAVDRPAEVLEYGLHAIQLVAEAAGLPPGAIAFGQVRAFFVRLARTPGAGLERTLAGTPARGRRGGLPPMRTLGPNALPSTPDATALALDVMAVVARIQEALAGRDTVTWEEAELLIQNCGGAQLGRAADDAVRAAVRAGLERSGRLTPDP